MRIEKINQQLKREISTIIQRVLDDRRFEFVTILRVQASKDLHHARVFFSVLGDAEKIRMAKEGLSRAAGLIRRTVGERLVLRYNPVLEFIYDDSLEVSDRIDRKLKELNEENSQHN